MIINFYQFSLCHFPLTSSIHVKILCHLGLVSVEDFIGWRIIRYSDLTREYTSMTTTTRMHFSKLWRTLWWVWCLATNAVKVQTRSHQFAERTYFEHFELWITHCGIVVCTGLGFINTDISQKYVLPDRLLNLLWLSLTLACYWS